ncbi:folylpolyglutamate synthase, mitochondrial-like [Haliotis cracherodii]|uniref:folylpolyglutamate synthase, mitochondrial-like n=1 Tax=Haliotis cracherodii TaxID=6455 RepID=UPI0039EA6926
MMRTLKCCGWVERCARGTKFGKQIRHHSISYDETMKTWHSLHKPNFNYLANIRHMKHWMKRIGRNMEDLSKLNVLHITGTKGKGSTSAFCENILRHHGYKTGVYSSPHLVSITERFLFDGKPVETNVFKDHFWDIYNRLLYSRESEDDMPHAFAFLTLLAFDLFLAQGVDALILEVGIGGQYDCTNIVETPTVCGVTSLHVDHISLLGNTIESVAWHKGGIFKPGTPAVTVPQDPRAMKVLEDRAEEIGTTLYETPSLASYDNGPEPIRLGIPGHVQNVNASLALQMCKIWLKTGGNGFRKTSADEIISSTIMKRSEKAQGFKLTDSIKNGLAQTNLPGRAHIISRPGVTYYLDTAHTDLSIQHCAEWFDQKADEERSKLNGRVARVLIFYGAEGRDQRKHLSILQQRLPLDAVIFTPYASPTEDCSIDYIYDKTTKEEQFANVLSFKEFWDDNTSTTNPIPTEGKRSGKPCASFTARSFPEALIAATGGRDLSIRGIGDFISEGKYRMTSSGDLYRDPSVTHATTKDGICLDYPQLPEQVQNADHVQILLAGGFKIIGHGLWYLRGKLF